MKFHTVLSVGILYWFFVMQATERVTAARERTSARPQSSGQRPIQFRSSMHFEDDVAIKGGSPLEPPFESRPSSMIDSRPSSPAPANFPSTQDYPSRPGSPQLPVFSTDNQIGGASAKLQRRDDHENLRSSPNPPPPEQRPIRPLRASSQVSQAKVGFPTQTPPQALQSQVPQPNVAFPAPEQPPLQSDLRRVDRTADLRAQSKAVATPTQPEKSLKGLVETKILPQQRAVAAWSGTDTTDLLEPDRRAKKSLPLRSRRDSMVLAEAMLNDQTGVRATPPNLSAPKGPPAPELTPEEVEHRRRYISEPLYLLYDALNLADAVKINQKWDDFIQELSNSYKYILKGHTMAEQRLLYDIVFVYELAESCGHLNEENLGKLRRTSSIFFDIYKKITSSLHEDNNYSVLEFLATFHDKFHDLDVVRDSLAIINHGKYANEAEKLAHYNTIVSKWCAVVERVNWYHTSCPEFHWSTDINNNIYDIGQVIFGKGEKTPFSGLLTDRDRKTISGVISKLGAFARYIKVYIYPVKDYSTKFETLLKAYRGIPPNEMEMKFTKWKEILSALKRYSNKYLTSHIALTILKIDLEMPIEYTSQLDELRNECIAPLISQIAIRMDDSQNRQDLYAILHEIFTVTPLKSPKAEASNNDNNENNEDDSTAAKPNPKRSKGKNKKGNKPAEPIDPEVLKRRKEYADEWHQYIKKIETYSWYFTDYRFASPLAAYVLTLMLDSRLKVLSLNMPVEIISQMKANLLISDSFALIDERAMQAHSAFKMILAELSVYQKYAEAQLLDNEKKDEIDYSIDYRIGLINIKEQMKHFNTIQEATYIQTERKKWAAHVRSRRIPDLPDYSYVTVYE